MGVIADFTVGAEDFDLGAPTEGGTELNIEVEPIVPASDQVFPYVWVTGEYESFEEGMEACEYAEHYEFVEQLGERRLYRITWNEGIHDLLACFVEANGTILRARGGNGWRFTVRFPDDASVSKFHGMCQERDIHLDLHRLTHVEEGADSAADEFGLTPEQREALMHAVKTGYFSIPRQSTLDDIAEQFDISNQAASERIRRATEKVLRQALVDQVDALVEHP
ncbi:helix-turn-helix domain-containing protein [Haloarchaeobius amylolyticus]|uniref:helix-turn-helix domain-containing protein n=1 Tax=Haloarchaeobius amylolyticus TaxID=1198296 RepID=UPI00226F174B|nr:helix-turn-helix domain-containing protein [Haloarchaeobius amylolyticus]